MKVNAERKQQIRKCGNYGEVGHIALNRKEQEEGKKHKGRIIFPIFKKIEL
jgi:hypothetical protein